MTLSLPTFTGGLEVTATQLQQLSDALSLFNDPDRCKAYQTSAVTSLNNTTGTLILFDAEEYDTNSMHSTSTNTSRITIQQDGHYLILGSIGYAANTTGYRNAHLLVNGTAIARAAVQSPPTVNAVVQVSSFKDLVATNYVELQGQQSSGGALDTVVGGAYTWLAVTRLHD